MGLLKSFFHNSYSERELRRIDPVVNCILTISESYKKLSDESLQHKTNEFKNRIKQGETLDKILPEAYAVVIEAADRILNMRPYRVQVQGAVLLHQGRIAELKTGEGKTLVETMPAYLNALSGKGVHVVTVNDYLAARDAEQMGQIYQFLGLTTGVITHDMEPEDRKSAYACDITYATNNELGFDYLRDNMATFQNQTVQRGLNYALIDEIDSVLIDEAGTPLIISGKSETSDELIRRCDVVVKTLKEGAHQHVMTCMDKISGETIEESGDYMINPEDRNIVITCEGTEKVEKALGLKNLADPENLAVMHCVLNALKANYIMQKDQDYIVQDDEILIIDEFTGRVLPGRRFTDGLHQAIEAKEHVTVNGETMTYASITFQSFFNKYQKKGGMSGTAITQQDEFRDIYSLDVVEVPTNRPIIRIDRPDIIYKTEPEKMHRVMAEVKASLGKGQPVLIGTASVIDSEKYSKALTEAGISHVVLNAKNHAAEAEIISHAGESGRVTIATNMAGRGADIKLTEKAYQAGGLKVIGTQRHESRRIDNQLRGRAGRQGDPGESVFIVSLEDELVQRFAAQKLEGLYTVLGIQKDEPIISKQVTKVIEGAQKKVESVNYGRRKRLTQYDDVLSTQRDAVYDVRNSILEGKDMSERIKHMVSHRIDAFVKEFYHKEEGHDNSRLYLVDPARQKMDLGKLLWDRFYITDVDVDITNPVTAAELSEKCLDKYNQLTASEEPDVVREIERIVLLKAIDVNWVQNLTDMSFLKDEIWTRAYAQKDPVQEYKIEGYDMFKQMEDHVEEDVVKMLFGILEGEQGLMLA